MSIEIVMADLDMPAHGEAILRLMGEYVFDLTGGEGLADYVQANLVAELAKRENVYVLLAWVDDEPAGMIVCIEGFSTFACKPLLNIHDVFVAVPYRGKGLSKLLVRRVEEMAIGLGCCKLTLEVLEGNHVAQAIYRACGFDGYELNPVLGKALFWEKKLDVQ